MGFKAKRYDFCKRCGELMMITSPNKLFCTRKCTLAYEVENYVPMPLPDPKICVICGEEFIPKSSASIAKYCSAKCRNKRPKADKEYYIKYREANRDQRREYTRQWSQDNPEIKEAARARYRASKHGMTIESSAEDRRRAKKEYASVACACCGLIGRCEIDHVKPLSKGGFDVYDNFQPLCRPCNSSKGNREKCQLIHIVIKP